MVDDALPGIAGVGEDAGQRGAEQGVNHQHDGDDGQRGADAATRRLQHHHDHDGAHDPIERIGIADAELQVVEHPGHVEARHHGGDGQRPVDEANPERGEQAGFWCLLIGAAARRKDEKDQRQHEGDMDAAMGRLGQQAEPRGVVVKAGQHEQKHRHQPGDARQQRPELHLRIEFGLELLQVGRQVRERIRLGHGNDSPEHAWSLNAMPQAEEQASRPLRFAQSRTGITWPARLPCRISRPPGAAGCRGRRAPSPCGSPCPWRGRHRERPASCRSTAPW